VFRFIIEYSSYSFRDFRPPGNRSIVMGRIFERYIFFWLVLKQEISYRVINILKYFWFLLEDFFGRFIIFLHGESFPYFFFCLKTLFNVNGKATVWQTSCLYN